MLRLSCSTYSPVPRSPAITIAGSPGRRRIEQKITSVMPASTGTESARRRRTYGIIGARARGPASLLHGGAEVHQEAGLVADILDALVPDLEVDELVD